MDPLVEKRARYWAESKAFDAETRGEIQKLIDSKDERELTERFYRDLEFGTGGMRGIMAAGTNRLNIYNIRKATTAFASYLREAFGAKTKGQIGVAIAYDSRRFSREFARATAEVLAAHEIKAFITKELRPTPMLSFMVRHFGCKGGVCVTASHNPSIYNGYKVYWDTGGQVIPPHDEAIIQRYLAIEDYDHLQHLEYNEGVKRGLIVEVGEDFDKIYFDRVEKLAASAGTAKALKIVYTPLHGTGMYPVVEALKRFGFGDTTVVPEQGKPDGAFPTVKFPNPEDPEALTMAIALGKKIGADLVLATDPDTDRIGIVVREGDELVILNGNQIGCLLTEYVLSSAKKRGSLPADPLVVKTIVTTDLQADIAAFYGAHCDETLTGFKWICQLIEDYERGVRLPRRTYVCGGEESYGFLADSFVRDKDAVSASCLAAEMVFDWKQRGVKLSDVIDGLFSRHGVYQEALHTVTLPGRDGAEKIRAIMDRFRQRPPLVIDGVALEKLRDFESCQEFVVVNEKISKKADLTLPKSDVLQFILTDGTKISVRPSGTEPKIKFYVSVKDATAIGCVGEALKKRKIACIERVGRVIDSFVGMAI